MTISNIDKKQSLQNLEFSTLVGMSIATTINILFSNWVVSSTIEEVYT